MFRRKLEANEPTDYSITDDLMHVIWARGQESSKYVHVPPSGLEKEDSSVPEFYQPDELKYHGHKMQRGLTQINFLEDETKQSSQLLDSATSSNQLDNDCVGHWRYPRDCSPEKLNCEYYASWATVGKGDEVHFKIQTTNVNTWTGIGFSNDDKMSQTDAVIGWVDKNGKPFLMDTWINGYSPPKLDDKQDIYNASGRIHNGATILEFTRKRTTNDNEQDLSFTDEHCLYLMFPINGGSYNAVNKKLRKHEQIPFVTASRVCIKSCGKELEMLATATTPSPNRLVYAVGVKLMNLAQSFESPKKGTPEFDNLASQISDSFNGPLSGIPGYHKIDVLDFEKYVSIL